VLREEVLSYDRRMKIVRVSGAKYAGKELADTGLAETEGVVVAVEHDGDIVIDVDSDFVFEEGDEVLFVGAGDVMREVVASEAAH
jgi:Trk K+ transport system NAD-binding subunit